MYKFAPANTSLNDNNFRFNTYMEYAIAAMTRMVDYTAFLEEEENSVQDDPAPHTSNNEFLRWTEIDDLKTSVKMVQDSLASVENKIDALTHQPSTQSFADVAKEAGGRSPSQGSRFQNPAIGLATDSPSVAAAVKPKKSNNVAAFGTVIYQNAIVLQNFTKEVPTHHQERHIFLANFLNERLSGRL